MSEEKATTHHNMLVELSIENPEASESDVELCAVWVRHANGPGDCEAANILLTDIKRGMIGKGYKVAVDPTHKEWIKDGDDQPVFWSYDEGTALVLVLATDEFELDIDTVKAEVHGVMHDLDL